jgi:xanthine dehydrogenase accessory factor
MSDTRPIILIRGAGDLATGVAIRLHRAGCSIVMTEIEQPLAIRRLVAFAQAVFDGETNVEGVQGTLAPEIAAVHPLLESGQVAVLVDPQAASIGHLHPAVVVDARMLKVRLEIQQEAAPLLIGLGPGFEAGRECHAIIETKRGHTLGRVIWDGRAADDTTIPDPVAGKDVNRVLRAPVAGIFFEEAELGSLIRQGERIANVDGSPLVAPFDGALRGLLRSGIPVHEGFKVGDLDPRNVQEYCSLVSDKALAVGGGVLEAILSWPEIRMKVLC